MKVKDLQGLNPEAEIRVVFPDGIFYSGKLSYGWTSNDGDSTENPKDKANEVCIFLEENNENFYENNN